MKPGGGSPALGAGSSCDATDELGVARPASGCDLGALELTLVAPVVSTGAASAVSPTGATLNGQVDPNGGDTPYHFELSADPAFASFRSLPSAGADAGAGTATVAISSNATGLTPATAYYYRLVASNSGGSTTSTPAQKFTTLSVPPPPTRSSIATVGDQRITLTTPSPVTCTANSKKLPVALGSTKIAKSQGPKLKFASAAFYIDKGVKHTKHRTVHTRPHKTKRVLVTVYTANATAHHAPVTLQLSIARLKPGAHTLTVRLSYKQTKRQHGHKITVTVTKTLKATFKIC